MAALFGKRRNSGTTGSEMLADVTSGNQVEHGWRFSIKGSPRHYEDVRRIIESDSGAVGVFR